MPHTLPPLRLTGARVLLDGALRDADVSIVDGQFGFDSGHQIDLRGYLLLPGIIDLHGDGFERHIWPRPTADFPISSGLAGYDREAAHCGVTTAYLAQGWSWEGGHRGPDQAERLVSAVAERRAGSLTDQRVQLRVETHLPHESERLLKLIETMGVDYVIFNDHLEEGMVMSRTRPEAFAYWARKVGLTSEQLVQRLKDAKAESKVVPRNLCYLANGFERLGVRFGSHDDPDAETREFYSMIGARVAEFPTSRRAAAATRSMGDPVLMGAPNVVRGGSQAGNVSGLDLIREGLCDALVSDYHLPALPMAAWRLVDLGMMEIAEAWAFVSTAPAQIMKMADRGQIKEGLRADLAIVNAETREIEATLSKGALAFAGGAVAQRLIAPMRQMQLAAE